ncbi:MAG: hypothetical protein U0350_37775 [Caldilineaceae bacterium]
MIFSFDYNSSYAGPPFPIVEITIHRLDKTREQGINLIALVDSEADITILPNQELQRINAPKVDQRRLKGAYGPSFTVDIHEVTLWIGQYRLPQVRVVADRENSECVVGRNVLNRFIVTLNGLAGVVDVTQ